MSQDLRRRFACLAALALLACQGPGGGSQTDEVPPETTAPWGGLEAGFVGVPLAQARRVLVFFHGYGATADDLMPLSEVLSAGPDAVFLFPGGPHALDGGGRCWRRRDGTGFAEARASAVALLDQVSRENPEASIVVGGFSQGAMMAGSLLAEGGTSLEGAILFSPSSESPPRPFARTPAPVLLSHGRSDRVVRIAESEALRRRLEAAGGRVVWFAFDGGHAIPGAVVAAANDFLAQTAERASP